MTASSARTCPRSTVDRWTRTSSPTGCPCESLIALNASTSMSTSAVPPGDRARSSAVSSAMSNARRVARPVSESTCRLLLQGGDQPLLRAVARTSISAITARTAPKKTKSVSAAAAGSRANRVSASPKSAVGGHDRHAGGAQVRRGEEDGKAKNAWAAAEVPGWIRFSVQISPTPATATTGLDSRAGRASSGVQQGAGNGDDDETADADPVHGDRDQVGVRTLLPEHRQPGHHGRADQQDQPRAVRGRLRVTRPQGAGHPHP